MADKEYTKFQYFQNNTWQDRVFDNAEIFTNTGMCYTEPIIISTLKQSDVLSLTINANSISPLDSYNYTGKTLAVTPVDNTDEELDQLIMTCSQMSLLNSTIILKESVLKRGFSGETLFNK